MIRSKTPALLVAGLFTALGTFWFVRSSRAAVATPDYKVIRKDGKFEVRDYPSLIVATTPMDDGKMNRGFGQLFRFITGSNERSEKIAMTSPVLKVTRRDGSKLRICQSAPLTPWSAFQGQQSF